MKKIILFLVGFFLITTTNAQMSADDQLKFRQAQDAYDNGNYFGAAQLTYEIKKKWTPATLYLYLKSVYKSYIQPGGPNGGGYDKSYDNFILFNNYSNLFFKTVDKSTYPQDKYADIVTAQQYFQQMQTKYEYQKDRTPLKAVTFLNECLSKFGKDVVLREARYYGERPVMNANKLRFQLDSPYLKFEVHATDEINYGKGKKNLTISTTYYRVTLLDFSRSTKFGDNYNNILDGQFSYENGQKLMQHIFKKTGFIELNTYTNLSTQPEDNIQRNERQLSRIKSDTTGFPPLLKTDTWGRSTTGIDVFEFFTTTSQEFIDGKYRDRIKEAFQYLSDYYPKAKAKTVDDKVNGF